MANYYSINCACRHPRNVWRNGDEYINDQASRRYRLAAVGSVPVVMPPWLRADGDGVMLQLHIQPGAKKTEVVGAHGDALKIRLAAPPVDGKANAALLAFVAAKVGAGRTAVELVSGQTSRSKRVRVAAIDPAAVLAAVLNR